MKANELRLGNWVCNYATGTHYKIQTIEDFCNTVEDIEAGFCEPIALTPEIFGKVDIPGSSGCSIELFKITGDIYFHYYGESMVRIQYIHQLQNLYFAITGEELSITL